MINSYRAVNARLVRLSLFSFLIAALLFGASFRGGVEVSANHPVFVEGNCDSPVPGTTIVAAGTCGDYDGDTRIGTAEDTDGADRIFGTLNAALGPGTGAAAGTGANHNGLIVIVRSGRFAETLYIGAGGYQPGQGVANPGNVTIEAAPGVEAVLDAVLQGDPAGGNNTRQSTVGIQIVYPNGNPSVVTLRNLVIRNFFDGVQTWLFSRVNIDNCRFENNLSNNMRLADFSRVVISNTQSLAAGARIGTASSTPSPGNGLLVRDGAQVRVFNSVFANNRAAGISNTTGNPANLVLFKVASFLNDGGNIIGPATVPTDPNFTAN